MKPPQKKAGRPAQKDKPRERRPRLTPRQLQILRLVRDGLTSREIAYRFGLSVRTIEVHRYLLTRRLGVKNVAQLLRAAVKWGFLKY